MGLTSKITFACISVSPSVCFDFQTPALNKKSAILSQLSDITHEFAGLAKETPLHENSLYEGFSSSPMVANLLATDLIISVVCLSLDLVTNEPGAVRIELQCFLSMVRFCDNSNYKLSWACVSCRVKVIPG